MELPVIFDLDGVLIDTERHFKLVDHTFLQALIPHWSPELQLGIWGMSIDGVFEHLQRDHGYRGGRARFFAHYEELSERIFGREVSLFEGAREVLERLSAERTVALCSGAPRRWIEIVITRFSLSPFFTVVVSAEDVSNTPKPSPLIYLEVLKRLGVSAGVAIEDSTKGVTSALGAGLLVIGYRNGMNEDVEFKGVVGEVRSLLHIEQELSKLDLL